MLRARPIVTPLPALHKGSRVLCSYASTCHACRATHFCIMQTAYSSARARDVSPSQQRRVNHSADYSKLTEKSIFHKPELSDSSGAFVHRERKGFLVARPCVSPARNWLRRRDSSTLIPERNHSATLDLVRFARGRYLADATRIGEIR